MLSEATAFAAPPRPPSSDASTSRRTGPPPASKGRGYLEGGPGGDPTVGARTTEEDHTGAWSYATGSESGPNYTRPAEEKSAQLKVNPIGYYQGVSVAGENLPPFAPQDIATGAAVLTWTGFERGNGVSRVFFQLSAGVAPEPTIEGNTITYRLPNTSVNVRNNKRRLNTSFFRTPVTSVSIRRSGADTIIKIRLRRDAVPQTSVTLAPNGYTMFVIEFADLSGSEA